MLIVQAEAGRGEGLEAVVAYSEADRTSLAALLALAFLLGNVALQYGASRLPAQATALIMLSEVVFASVSSVAMGAASFSTRTGVGALLILLAAFWASLPTRPRQAPQ